MRFRSLRAVVLGVAVLAVGLAGCGQKGPLVLPKAQFTTATHAR
jgi:predicted small lipoprotein YifL